jgi:hypothetical protein
MRGHKHSFHTVVLFTATFAVAACAASGVPATGSGAPVTGTLAINLATATPDGSVYRLRDATITITGPDSVQVFHTEDQPDRSSLSANVSVGAYSALLDPGWRLERLELFSDATVNAELVSDNPLSFTVELGQRTVVPLRFRTNLDEIDLTQGYDIVLDIEQVAVQGVVVSSFFPASAPGLAVFSPNATDNTPPLRTIDGLDAQLVEAAGIAVAGNEILVADQFYPAINVFPRGASGELSPSRRIAGLNTELVLPTSIAVYHGEMYVADELGTVLVFPLAASDDVAPTREITGVRPESQIAIDRDTGELFIAEGFHGVVRVVPATTSGPATAVRILGGPHTGLVDPAGVALFAGFLFVSDAQTGDIRIFPELADGDAAPFHVITTAHNGVGSLGQLSVTRDEIFVVNEITGTVDVFPLDANGPISPTRSFAGNTPSLPFQPFGVAAF